MATKVLFRPFFFIGFATLTIVSCSCKTPESLHAEELYFSLPLISDSGEVYLVSDRVEIYYFNDLVLYQIPQTKFISEVYWDSQGNMIDSVVETKFENRYFVYKAKESFGYTYKSLDEEKRSKSSVDTFLMTTVLNNIIFFERHNFKFIEEKQINTNVVQEKYLPKKIDASYCDTMIFFYNKKYNHLRYSLSGELDSLKQSKMFKVIGVYNPFYDSSKKKQIPGTELVFEIKPIQVYESKVYIDFLKSFKP